MLLNRCSLRFVGCAGPSNCSFVSPPQVLHQYAGRMKLELVFNESNGSCEGPFSARVCLKGSRGWGLQQLPSHSRPWDQGVIAEATGVVSIRLV